MSCPFCLAELTPLLTAEAPEMDADEAAELEGFEQIEREFTAPCPECHTLLRVKEAWLLREQRAEVVEVTAFEPLARLELARRRLGGRWFNRKQYRESIDLRQKDWAKRDIETAEQMRTLERRGQGDRLQFRFRRSWES